MAISAHDLVVVTTAILSGFWNVEQYWLSQRYGLRPTGNGSRMTGALDLDLA